MRLTKGQLKQIIREEYSRLKRQGLIHETWDTGQHNTWGIGGRGQKSRQPSLPETLEAIEIIKSHGGEYSATVYAPGEEYSDSLREVLIGRAGDAVFNVTVTPNYFSAQIYEGEKDYEKAELPWQKNKVNPNNYFAQGADFECNSIEEFEAHMEEAMEAYSVPMRSRPRRRGANERGWDHFRTK